MAKEMFPLKKTGDGLAASHVNDMGRVLTNLSGGNQGSGLQGSSGWITGTAAPIRTPVQYAKVIHDVVEAGDTTTSGLYLIVLRIWDESNNQWTWETDEYRLDVRGFSADSSSPQRGPVLLPEDRLLVVYDQQRGCFVPVSVEDGDKWVYAPQGGIPARHLMTEGSATCSFVKQVLNPAGDAITWSFLTDRNGVPVQRKVFNGHSHHAPQYQFHKVSINSIGQWHVECPCEEESESSPSFPPGSSSSSSPSTSSTSSMSQSSMSSSCVSKPSDSSGSSASVSSVSDSGVSSGSLSSVSSNSYSTNPLGFCCDEGTSACFGPVLRSVCEAGGHAWFALEADCADFCNPMGAMMEGEPDADFGVLRSVHATKPSERQTTRLDAIRSGTGVGSQVWNLLEEIGIQHDPRCDCLSWAEKMNGWGVAGCRMSREEISAHLKQEAKKLGWKKLILKSVTVAATHPEMIKWIDLTDVYGSIVDEAIRRAEEAELKKASDEFVPNDDPEE